MGSEFTRSHANPWRNPLLSGHGVIRAGRDNEDVVKFIDDPEDAGGPDRGLLPLVILVVDDDHDVHDSTRIALTGARILGRPIEIVHAYSAGHARTMLSNNHSIALVLLDVVMESQDAGTRFLAEMREDLERRDIRVIVRTGQPGYLPEDRFKDDRAVSSFLLKSRLTRSMLLDAITKAFAPPEN